MTPEQKILLEKIRQTPTSQEQFLIGLLDESSKTLDVAKIRIKNLEYDLIGFCKQINSQYENVIKKFRDMPDSEKGAK